MSLSKLHASGIENLLSRLDGVKTVVEGCHLAHCPSHEDKTPSLSIRETGDGTILVHCFAGCSALKILHAVGLELADLFPNRPPQSRPQKVSQHWHAVRAALKTLHTEVVIVVLAAGVIARGDVLNDEDYERLLQAAERIREAAGYCS